MSKALLDLLRAKFGDLVLATSSHCGDECAVIAPSIWYDAAEFLRDDPACDCSMFTDITAVDYPDRTARFELVLHLYSLHKQHRIRLKTSLFEATSDSSESAARPTSVKTLVPLYAAANWFEREVWDMFGIRFKGHADLRRILMYEEFEGHALRKDYDAARAQPLVPYREGEGVQDKLPPFRADEGMSWSRKHWTPTPGGWDLEEQAGKAAGDPVTTP